MRDVPEKEWASPVREIETYKRELDMLGVRYKVGELSLQEYQRASEQLHARIGVLQPGAGELRPAPKAAISAEAFPRPWTRLVGMLGGLLLLISVFLPWLAASETLGREIGSVSGISASAIIGTIGIVCALTAIATVFLLPPRRRGAIRIVVGMVALVALLAIVLAGSLPLLSDYVRTMLDIREGFYLYVIAAAVLFVTGILERRESG